MRSVIVLRLRRLLSIHLPARLVGEPKKTKKERQTDRQIDRHPKQWQTGYSPRPPTSSDQNQTLHGGWPAVYTYTYQVSSKSVKDLRRCGGRKWPFPITLASGFYNSLYYGTMQAVIPIGFPFSIPTVIITWPIEAPVRLGICHFSLSTAELVRHGDVTEAPRWGAAVDLQKYSSPRRVRYLARFESYRYASNDFSVS